MKHATQSYWFWLLILGVFLILLAALIGGGKKEVNGWIWGIFIAGAVLSILGIIFAIVAWSRATPCYVEPACDVASSPSRFVPNSPVSTINTKLATSSSFSPMGTPTRIASNIPQAQRGFSTTNLDLSQLSPK